MAKSIFGANCDLDSERLSVRILSLCVWNFVCNPWSCWIGESQKSNEKGVEKAGFYPNESPVGNPPVGKTAFAIGCAAQLPLMAGGLGGDVVIHHWWSCRTDGVWWGSVSACSKRSRSPSKSRHPAIWTVTQRWWPPNGCSNGACESSHWSSGTDGGWILTAAIRQL